MLTDMKTAIDLELDYLDEYSGYSLPRTLSIATGYAAYGHICEIADMIEKKFDGLKIHVYKIKNEFFGESITVSGLLTGADLLAQLSGCDLGDELLIPSSALRADGDVLLDDISPEQLSEQLGVTVTPTSGEASCFIRSVLGIN